MPPAKVKKESYGKLLDAWVPPQNAGDPLGCIATSFTFSPVFFEEECLSRFLQLETDAAEDGPLYLIEREEKLAQVTCAIALVDQHHCKGSRSLRWDMLPARVPGGLLHAKISILCWMNCVRLIIASANLTEDGYRRNQEIFGMLDYRQGGSAPLSLLREVVRFLKQTEKYFGVKDTSQAPVINRWHGLLDRVLDMSSEWGVADEQIRSKDIKIWPALSGPGEGDVFEKLNKIWPANSPPITASVVSPFFDPPEAANRPAAELWKLLRKKGVAGAEFYVTAEEIAGEQRLLIHAPESLLRAQPKGRPDVYTDFYKLDLEEARPLHAKAIWLADDRWAVYMIGSSNFTSAGLGLSAKSNLEANLAYVVDINRNRKAYQLMSKAFLPGEKIDYSQNVKWQPRSEEEEDKTTDMALLPEAFATAVYDVNEALQPVIAFIFNGQPPTGWKIVPDDSGEIFFCEQQWQNQGCPMQASLAWQEDRPPSGFWVRWDKSDGQAWLPVNVASGKTLPPPDELKDLPLEVLITILTTARPLYRVLNEYLKKKAGKGTGGLSNRPIVDPHAKIDTSRFLLQRTRRISCALNALKERIERPVYSEECLHWRIEGPVGVRALAAAIIKEAHSGEEKKFLMAELALELSRAKPKSAPGCLPTQRILDEIARVNAELKIQIEQEKLDREQNLTSYIKSVFAAIAP